MVVRVGRLVDCSERGALDDAEIRILDGVIESVARTGTGPEDSDAVLVDLSDRIVFPGLIDAHMHFYGVPSRELHRRPTEREPLRALRAAGEARDMLLAGITSARDLGSSIGPDMRRAIDLGYIPGPRLQAAGEYVTTTGGTWEFVTIPIEWAQQRDIMADGPEQMRAIVRRRARSGATTIKLGLSKGMVDDKFHSWGHDPLQQVVAMSLDEVRAAVDEAHVHGMKVSAHAIGDASVRLALDGEVDVIEHAYSITEETRSRLAKSGTLVGSTLSQVFSHIQAFETYQYPEWERRAILSHARQLESDFRLSLQAGVRYVLGSDLIGGPTHLQATAAREFEYAVQWGMTPESALRAGTVHASEALGWEDKIGTIEPGKIADLIALDTDPREDITALQRPSFVMQSGRIIRDGDTAYV